METTGKIYNISKFTTEENLTAIKEYIDQNGITSLDGGGYYVLCEALRYNYLEMATFLVEKGAKVNIEPSKDIANHPQITHQELITILIREIICDHKGFTPLHHAAAAAAHIPIAELLLQRGANPNSTNMDGESPLHIAVKKGDIQILEFLLKNGANIHSINRKNEGLLHYAVQTQNIEIIKYLVKHGANINAKDYNGNTPLHLAVKICKVDIINSMCDMGADILVKNYFCASPYQYSIEKRKIDVAMLFLKGGANINSNDLNGNTILHVASKEGELEHVKRLLSLGANIDAKNYQGLTPLSCAIIRRNYDIVKLLLLKGANVNVQDNDGKTLLLIAILKGNVEIVELILDFGACVNMFDKNGNTPLHAAVYAGNEILTKKLLERGATNDVRNVKDITPFRIAVENQYIKIAEFLYLKGASVNSEENEGVTPLHAAVALKSPIVVKKLLGYGALNDSKVESKNGSINLTSFIGWTELHGYGKCKRNRKLFLGCTPLHWAVECGKQTIIEMLLSGGANVNICDDSGITPLHVAACMTNISAARMLLKKGADINAMTSDKDTPLHVACETTKNPEIVDFLLKNGAHIDVCDGSGLTPLHISCKNKSESVFQILLRHGGNIYAISNKSSLLHTTIKTGNETMVRSLLKNEAKIYRNSKVQGYETMVRILTEDGATIDYKDQNGYTILHLAALKCHPKMANIILRFNPDLDAVTKTGDTALHLAFKSRSINIIKSLIKHGANINSLNYNGYPATQFVTECCYRSKISEFLRLHIAKMKAANLFINNEIFNFVGELINDQSVKRATKTYNAEITKMKNEKIGDTFVSYYDFLSMDIKQLANYVCDKTISKCLETRNLKVYFPSYYNMILANFKRAKRLKKLLSTGMRFLNFVNKSQLPMLCGREILKYLEKKDLENIAALLNDQ